MIRCKLGVSLLELDYRYLARDLENVEKAGIDFIHIDVMDGHFVPGIGIGTRLIQSIRPVTDLTFDVHMMVEEPAAHVEKMARAGADIITVHYEACQDLKGTLSRIKNAGCKAGLVLSPDTPLEVLGEELLQQVDVIQLMTTYPGIEGQKFIPASIERIRQLRKRLDLLGLETKIEVDGNITMENIGQVTAAGAEVIVSGRALVHGNMMENIPQMKALM